MTTLVGDVTPDAHLSFPPYQRAIWRRSLAGLKGKRVSLTLEEYKDTRSQKANAYYWSVVLKLLSAETGMTPEEIHDAMCVKFLPNEAKRVEFFNRMTGECMAVEVDRRRSSKLKGGAFYDFVETVRLWGVEFLGVITPDPDPEYWRRKKAKAA